VYTKQEIIDMLLADGDAQGDLFREARRLRQQSFGNGVVIRGVIEVTNICRINCDYCPMRRDNTFLNDTYILSEARIVDTAYMLQECNINIVFLQGGEIPQTTAVALKAIAAIKTLFAGNVEILLCLGIKSRQEYADLKQAGATSYILKHETSDAFLHEQIRHESLRKRLQAIEHLLSLGYKVGTGVIIGLPGQRLETIADDLLLAANLGVHMASASPFVPAANTPLTGAAPGKISLTLNAIAASRLINPLWLIPAVSALQQGAVDGQLAGLNAGANVLTINFTPSVQQGQYLIYGATRYRVTLNHVTELLSSTGLVARGSVWIPSIVGQDTQD